MAPPSLNRRDETGVGAQLQARIYREPLAGTVVSVILTLVSLTILSIFLIQRSQVIKVWSKLPYVAWLVLAIYVDSYLFVFSTAILQFGFGVDSALSICEAAILLCLVCYVTTKVVRSSSKLDLWMRLMVSMQLIYLFLVEKVYIIRGALKKRMKSKLYLFNSFGMIGVYVVVAVLNFVFRFTKMEGGQCIIGMQKAAMIPLISFDALVNVYLTILFIVPLVGLYSFKHLQRTPANIRLRRVATRTLVGAVCTLISSIVNLSVLMGLDGEPGWVCLMCCNSDILFSAIVIQWITSNDNNATSNSNHDHSNYTPESVARRITSDPPHKHQRPSSISSLTSPSTKPIIEDIAEIGLDQIRRQSLDGRHLTLSSRGGSDDKVDEPRPVLHSDQIGAKVARGSRYSLGGGGFEGVDSFGERVKDRIGRFGIR